MYIVIAGCGKVGFTLARHLSEDKHDILIIDKKSDPFDKVVESIDVMVLKGNCLSAKALNEAEISRADLIICVTGSDEANILCCLTAKKLGAKYTIARVRDPEYALELLNFKKDLGLDMIINPEQQTALEISRLLRFPSAEEIETFVNGRIEIASFSVESNDFFDKLTVALIAAKINMNLLLCLVERGNDVIIPYGSLILQENDQVHVLGSPSDISNFFKVTGKFIAKIRSVMVIGGGKITYYLAEIISKLNMHIKIIEIDRDRALELEERLDGINNLIVINGDGTDESLLMSEGLKNIDAVICLTDRDEENVIIGLYATAQDVPKVIVKTNRVNQSITNSIGLRSIVSPKNTTAYQIIRYVRALSNSYSSINIQTMYKIFYNETDSIEAIEFNVKQNSKIIGMPIKDMDLRKDILIGCIVRRGKIIIPRGNTEIIQNDTIIIIAKNQNIDDSDDVLR